jgi:hypothetical protein
VVVRFAPFHCTCETGKNPDPVTVNAKALDPAFTDAGRIDATVGAGFGVIVKENAEEVPPPGVGFTTVTAVVPVEARSVARIAAVNCEELTNVVARLTPFHCTTEFVTKFPPLTVSVNAPALTAADDG